MRIQKKKTPFICRIVISLVTAGFFFSACSDSDAAVSPELKKGILELPVSEEGKIPMVHLDGEWEFYWKRFLSVKDFKKPDMENPDLIANVPHVWKDESVNGNKISPYGYGTYRLHVKLKNYPSLKKSPLHKGSLALKVITICTAFDIFIDDKKIGNAGKPAAKKALAIPKEHPQVFYFDPPGKEFDVIIHTSNYHHRNSGFWNSVIIGPANAMEHLRKKKIAAEFFLLGCLLIMAFYHFVLFLLRKNEKSHLYFSIVSFILGIRNLFTGERFIMNFFSSLDFTYFMRFAYLDTFLAFPFFVIFLHSVFPQDSKKIVWLGASVAAGIFSVFLFLLPVELFVYIMPLFELLIVLYIFIVLIILIRAVKNMREGARTILAGYLFLFVVVLMDILNNLRVVLFPSFTPMGFLAFLLFHSYMLSSKFSRLFDVNKKLSMELNRNNTELVSTLKELNETQEKLILKEKTAIIGNLSSGLAQVIKNQLESISRLSILEKKISEEDSGNLQYVYDSRDRIISLLDEIKAIANNSEIKYEMREETLSLIIEEAVTLVRLDPDVKGKRIKIVDNFKGSLLCNRNKLLQVFLNLIRNAAQAVEGCPGGEIVVRTDGVSGGVRIEVEDNGVGIPEETITTIWEPFFSTKGETGTGIGLNISKNILEGHEGTISCRSTAGAYTLFEIFLPVAGQV